MKKIDLVQTIQIFANVGVIAGIIFLAIEIRQNQVVLEEGNQMNLVSLSIAANRNFSDFRSLILENEDLFRIWQSGLADQDLSELDEAKFQELCAEFIFKQAITYRNFQLVDEEAFTSNAVGAVQRNMESDRFLTCWQRIRGGVRNSSDAFVSLVEEGVEQ